MWGRGRKQCLRRKQRRWRRCDGGKGRAGGAEDEETGRQQMREQEEMMAENRSLKVKEGRSCCAPVISD